MKKLLAIAVLISLVSGCEQMSKEQNYAEKRAKTLQPTATGDNAEILNQDGKQEAASTEPPLFQVDKEQTHMKETEKDVNKTKDVGEILNEIEKLICEGDCSPYSLPPRRDLSELKNNINSELQFQ